MVHSLPPIPVSLLKRFDPSTAMFLSYGNAMTRTNNGWFSMGEGVDDRDGMEFVGPVTWRDIGVKSHGAVEKLTDSLSLFSVMEKRFSKEIETTRPIILYRINPVIYERLVEAEPAHSHRGLAKSKGTLSRFDEFWAVYPNKQGKDSARKLWASKNYDEIADTIIEDVKGRVKNHKPWQNEIRFIPHGATYISKKVWLDDIIPFDNRLIAASSRQNSVDQARDMNIRTRKRTESVSTTPSSAPSIAPSSAPSSAPSIAPLWGEYELMQDEPIQPNTQSNRQSNPHYPEPTDVELAGI